MSSQQMTTNGWKGNQFVFKLLLILILQSQVTLGDGHSEEQGGPPGQSMSQSRFQTNFGQSREEGSESQSEESDESSEENGSEEGVRKDIRCRSDSNLFVLSRLRMAITVKKRNTKPLTKRRK